MEFANGIRTPTELGARTRTHNATVYYYVLTRNVTVRGAPVEEALGKLAFTGPEMKLSSDNVSETEENVFFACYSLVPKYALLRRVIIDHYEHS